MGSSDGLFGKHRNTRLMEAAGRGDCPKITRLLDKGADVNHRQESGRDQYYVAANTFISTYRSGGRTPLYLAAASGHARAAELLLEHGAQVDLCDEFGMTPLHRAVMAGSLETAALLLEKSARPDARYDAFREEATHYQAGDPRIGQTLTLQRLAKDHGQRTPLGILRFGPCGKALMDVADKMEELLAGYGCTV
ncbi:MAG: ankyrin repeat domain-containing protein [Clostridia bacterium]